jgi:hypothetical protein
MVIRILRGLTIGAALLATAAATALAQSAQTLSLQASGLLAGVSGEAYGGVESGVGFEAQLRYNFRGGVSLGVGYQGTSHAYTGIDDKASLSGPFLEPRFALDIRSMRNLGSGYVSARISALAIKLSTGGRTGKGSGTTFNVGGGFLWYLSPRLNLDTGVTYGYSSFGEFRITGGGSGDVTTPGGSGSNLVARVGVVVGLGI